MKEYDTIRKELESAKVWAQDETWVKKKKYQQDPEYLACVEDILEHPGFQSMEQYIQHGSTTCKAHCIQVSYMSYCICRKRNWDYRAVARAGLLHDLFLYDWHTHAKETGNHSHGYTHPRTALNNASLHFSLTKSERNMILRHMWPLTIVPPAYKEGYVLLFADKFCSLAEVAANARKKIFYAVKPQHLV